MMKYWRTFKNIVRPLKPLLIKMGLLKSVVPSLTLEEPFYSARYWERRYNQGGNSGPGSYGELAQYKADVVNGFISDHEIQSVIDFGCGDGNQLSLIKVPRYVGIDVSQTSIDRLNERYQGDATKKFVQFDPEKADGLALRADVSLSMDVIYHLVEDSVFTTYMKELFNAAEKFVIIYSSNCLDKSTAVHVRHRDFTRYVKENYSEWKLISSLQNPYKGLSHSSFFIFERLSLPNRE